MRLIRLTFWIFSISFAFMSTPNASTPHRLTHYNIKELDHLKILSHESNDQVQAATEILRRTQPDLISINEIQFDFPGIPNAQVTTEGKALGDLGRLVSPNQRFHAVFTPANTGKNAKPKQDGTFSRNSRIPNWMDFADHSNFGMFRAQYSNGLLSKYEVIKIQKIVGLKWREFNPNFDPSAFKDATGKPYNKDIELFDKSFTDVTLLIDGAPVHFVLLHTVPAFNFGNVNGFNPERNRDQLEFLRYYLTGINPYGGSLKIEPLKIGDNFIAVGDWNVDWVTSDLESANILRDLFSKFQLWKEGHNITYVSSSFQSQLDYILLSNDIEILKSKVHSNFSDAPDLTRRGSDHLAISVEFRLKKESKSEH